MIDHQDTDLPLSIRDEAFCQILRLMCGLLREPVLTRAAESLGITTPTASRRLARAREWFGDELFIYSAGRMVPTRRMIELQSEGHLQCEQAGPEGRGARLRLRGAADDQHGLREEQREEHAGEHEEREGLRRQETEEG